MTAVVAAAVVVSSAFALAPVATAARPAAVVPPAPTITSVVGGLVAGQLVVSYAAPAADPEAPVTGYEASVDAGASWWPCVGTAGTCTLTNLTNGTPYSVALRAVNAVGPGPASVPVVGTPSVPVPPDPDKPATLPKPRTWVGASFRPAINGLGVSGTDTRIGVGALPALTFTKSIPDKAVVENHLTVKALLSDGTSRVVKGAWGWISDRTAVFRPAKYWPGRAHITITSTLDRAVLGMSGKKYVIGSPKLATTWSFDTARKLIARVNGKTARMKVYIDGKKVKDFGVSLGKTDWETRNGVKVISTQKEPTHTYTSTSLGLGPEEEYELIAPWNTRLTPTGEFIHTAKWAYGRIGRYNGSHGCTNMFEQDAKWIYDKTIPGDVVEYTNTGGTTVPSWNGAGGMWNIPWSDWLEKSALHAPDGKPDTTNVMSGSGGIQASA